MRESSEPSKEMWLLDLQTEIDKAVQVIRKTMGSYATDKDPTYHFLNGYLSALADVANKFDI